MRLAMADIKYHNKKWNSLTQLKDYLEKEKIEKVLEFDGYELITEKYRYTIAFSELNVEKRK
jgi:hypothetical protein